ncbi:metal-dependent hydrolase [Planctomicrobium sp. SH664]|uniref:metal-dependent hydrolase n=1 Tax=Planctomicrobium sp. SH664 TaxID=3448125 RepID=UPI003F5AFE30
MAAFREHIAFSSLLGIGYGVAARFVLGFSPSEAALAGYLTGVSGMLPDLDLPTARPGREVFSWMAAVGPLFLVGHALRVTGLKGDTETVMLLMLCMYFCIRYGLAWIVDKLSIHRGMFHSLPAMAIAGELTYLAYPTESWKLKLLMAMAVTTGFFSHLLLDEIYSVQWKGVIPGVKKSFGTAIKFAGPTFAPTAFTYGLLATLTFLVGEQTGLIGPPLEPGQAPVATEVDQAAEVLPVFVNEPVTQAERPPENLGDAPLYR